MTGTTTKRTKERIPFRAARRADATRLCRRCGCLVVETAFPEGEAWVCADCLDKGVQAVMPLCDHNGHERYDTSAVFEGYMVKRIKQGGGREQWEAEVPAKSGEFYPVAEAAVGLLTKTAHTAKILEREFPEARVFTRGEDGRCVVHFPVTLWPKIARRCGAFKSRAGQPRSDSQLAAQQAATAKLAEARTKATPTKQLALEL